MSPIAIIYFKSFQGWTPIVCQTHSDVAATWEQIRAWNYLGGFPAYCEWL